MERPPVRNLLKKNLGGQPPRVPRKLPENKLETLEDVKIEHRNIRNWLMKGQLSERIAGTAIHNLEALAKIMMPSEIEETLNVIREKADNIERKLDTLEQTDESRGESGEDSESGTSGSSTVDPAK